MKRYFAASPEDTGAFGKRLGAVLRPGDVVYLSGDLGVGKSVVARGIGRALGVLGPMPSPTFTLLRVYEGRVPFHHFDLYRLEGADAFYDAGLDEHLGGEAVSAVEWPECAQLSWPGAILVALTRGEGANARAICVDAPKLRAEEIYAALDAWKEAE